MTREEAIHFATCLKNNWTINFDDMEEFCDMAIKTLNSIMDSENDAVKTENDLIERQDAIEAVRNVCNTPCNEYFVNALTALPSADITETEECRKCQETTERVLLNKASAEASQSLAEPNNDLRGSDLISRADAIEAVVCHIWHMPNEVYRQFNCENIVREVVEDAIQRLPSADAVDCTDFILWLLDEIMDEENWELNAVADGEIIARKLKKLGLLEVRDGYYVRTPSADAVLLDIEKWRTWSQTYDNMCKGGEDE